MWAKSLKNARDCLVVLALLVPPVTAAPPPTVDERWPVTLSSGRSLELVVRRPLGETRLPAVILFGGFEGTAQILDYIQSERPIVRASFAYPWDRPEDVGATAIPGILRDFGQAVRDTFEGIERLAALLREQHYVDPQRLMIVGASAGAPFATIAAQRNDIPGVIIVQGFGDIGDVIARQFDLSLVPDTGTWVKPFTWLFAHFAVWWLDLPHPERYADDFTAEQQVLVVTATDDERIPASATEALWSAIQASGARATRRDLAGGHLRGYGDPEIDRIMRLALDWMEDVELVPPPQ